MAISPQALKVAGVSISFLRKLYISIERACGLPKCERKPQPLGIHELGQRDRSKKEDWQEYRCQEQDKHQCWPREDRRPLGRPLPIQPRASAAIAAAAAKVIAHCRQEIVLHLGVWIDDQAGVREVAAQL